MALKSIPYGTRPKILLLGNGINRAFGSDSWGDILGRISCGTYTKKEIELLKGMPYPLQAVVASGACVDKGVELFAEKLCDAKLGEQHRDVLISLINNNFDAILTTNYSYEIEAAIDELFISKYKQRCSYRKSDYKGSTVDSQFGLFHYNNMQIEEDFIPIWHIHGEAARPKSIVLGHYYYGKLLSRLQYYVSNVISRYEGCNRYKKSFAPRSWLDYFLISDVHIVGLGLDTSELDLWWLINCKKIHSDKLGQGSIIWHEPNLDAKNSFSRKTLAETYGVKIDTHIVKANGYKQYYSSCISSLK